jgi:Zn-dependent protease
MGDFSAWSIRIGRWQGVGLRLHIFFVLFAVQLLYLAWLAKDPGLVGFTLVSLGVLLVSVLLHELGHLWTCLRFGGNPEDAVLWPLGGIGTPPTPYEPQIDLMTALAGPVVNAAIMIVVAPLLLISGESVLNLFVPLVPSGLTEGATFVVVLKLIFWINWLLLLFNLLPAFPFDGGYALRSVLSMQLDYRSSVLWVTRVAMIAALAICVLAYLVRDVNTTELVPTWVPLLLFAVFLWFGAQQEEARLEQLEGDEFLGYDFSQGYTSLERDAKNRQPPPNPIRRWLNERREARQRRQAEIEREEEAQMDQILARLHETGLPGLSPHERAILDRVSQRLRNRQQF